MENPMLEGMHAQKLKEKIADGSVRLATVGLGYVGLPLSVEFASAGLTVTGIDTNSQKVASIQSGNSYVRDVPAKKISELVDSGHFSVTEDFSVLADHDAIIICVPTPLSKTKDPDLSLVVNATTEISRRLRAGQIVVLESTTYPGTTEELILPTLQESGLEVGTDFFLAFSPERVDPGNKDYTIRNTPKVIGGTTPSCREVALALYARAVENVIPVTSTRAAEMVKLLENTFRSVNIAMVNEVALMCDRLGVDVWEVIDAAASKPFGYMPFYPGPGLGGHCIPIDPFYLSWKLKTLNYRARFIELAGEVNSSMPYYVVNKIQDALNEKEKAVKGSRVLLLGISYKRDIDDVRESPALDVLRILEQKGAEVSYHDPLVPELDMDGSEYRSKSLTEALATTDCVVILTDHSCFKVEEIVAEAPLVIDTRNATKQIQSEKIIKI
jgi:UDP-N-acetyl-D-glucosamine dehydrogenase